MYGIYSMMIMCTFSGVAGLPAYKVDMISQACIGSCDTRLGFFTFDTCRKNFSWKPVAPL